MRDERYRLRYLPLFYKDLDEKMTYIAEELKNLRAASDLLDKVETAILKRLPVAESFEPYQSPFRQLKGGGMEIDTEKLEGRFVLLSFSLILANRG